MTNTDAPPFPAPPGAHLEGNGGWHAVSSNTLSCDLPIHSAAPDEGFCCTAVGRYLCTEQDGHDGWHIATTTAKRVVGVWR